MTLKEKQQPWPYTPGSHKEKARLQKIQQVEGMPKTKQEHQVQRLSAMGQSRFKRLQQRLGKGSKDGGPPRYGQLPSQASQTSQPSQPSQPELGVDHWTTEWWVTQQWAQQQQAAWQAQAYPWQPPPVSGYVIFPGWVVLLALSHCLLMFVLFSFPGRWPTTAARLPQHWQRTVFGLVPCSSWVCAPGP